MEDKLTFHRLVKTNVAAFNYYRTRNPKPAEYDALPVKLNRLGFNMFYSIQNYTGEDVVLATSLKADPIVIPAEGNNGSGDRIEITIYTGTISNKAGRTVPIAETMIQITSTNLRKGAVFVEEIGAYMAFATFAPILSRFISEDSISDTWESLELNYKRSDGDAAVIYSSYEDISKKAISRQELLRIRVKRKSSCMTMKVAIMDHFFSPYRCDLLIEDPSLDEDVFVLETLRSIHLNPFESTFTKLKEAGTFYIDQNEVDTISGIFCNLVIFHSEEELGSYVHTVKAKRRFGEEDQYLREHSGDMSHKREIEGLNKIIALQKDMIGDLETRIAIKDGAAKTSTEKTKFLEKQVVDERGEYYIEYDNSFARENLRLEFEKLKFAREELDHKERMAKTTHKAAGFKTFGEIAKGIAAFAAGVAALIGTVVALYLKFKPVLKAA